MTCSVQNTKLDLAMELIIENGFDGVANTMDIMMNGAMQIDVNVCAGAGVQVRRGNDDGGAGG